jgi:uncharacterized protein
MENRMRAELEHVPITYNEAEQSFELIVEGTRAFIDFKKKANIISLIHTEVPEDIRGKGVAGSMVEKTFNYLEERGMRLVPTCSYVRYYLSRYPEWNRLL